MAFSHEKLIVYRKSLEFNKSAYELLESKNIKGDLKDQLSRATHSITLNIAEGNGKSTNKDRANFLQRSQGSATECAATFDLMVTEQKMTIEEAEKEKEILEEIVRILVKMIDNLANRSLQEEAGQYSCKEVEEA